MLSIRLGARTPHMHDEERALCLCKRGEVPDAACSASSISVTKQPPARAATMPTITSPAAQVLVHFSTKKPARVQETHS